MTLDMRSETAAAALTATNTWSITNVIPRGEGRNSVTAELEIETDTEHAVVFATVDVDREYASHSVTVDGLRIDSVRANDEAGVRAWLNANELRVTDAVYSGYVKEVA